MPSVKAIILLGGSGERFGGDTPKQFQLLSGKKVYLHTLEQFLRIDHFEEILLVSHPDYLEEVSKDIALYPQVRVIPGGKTRQASSFEGVKHCGGSTDFVVIHDAVRPFVSKSILLENIEQVQLHRAVDTCAPSFDTIVESIQDRKINRIPERNHYLRGQTPQSFAYPLILEAHQKGLHLGIDNSSDDCRLVLALGHPIHIVDGNEHNIKITTELDLFLAEQLMRLQRYPLHSQTIGSLKGKVYAVVGGSGGIGQAIRNKLHEEGACTLTLSRSSTSHPVDIRDESQVQAVFKAIEREMGPIDGLINSAGMLQVKTFSHMTLKEIQEHLEVNLHGVIYACKNCNLKPGGHIVNLASSSFTHGRKDYSIYSCAKAGVVNFSQALSEELPHLNVNAIVPGRTLTPMRLANFPLEKRETLLDPKQIADAVIELLKQNAITGQIIEVKKRAQ